MLEEPGATEQRRLAHSAVEAALRELALLPLKTQADSMLRVWLAFKALWRGQDPTTFRASGPEVKAVVERLFQILPGPKEFPGTISLRASGGKPSWLTNDSWRGSWIDYAGPNGRGRFLFEDEDWHNPLKPDAEDRVSETLGNGNQWPPRDVLAAIVLRDEQLDPELSWAGLIDRARAAFGLTPEAFDKVTSSPVLASLDPFDGDTWDPAALATELWPASGDTVQKAEAAVSGLPPKLAQEVERVLEALRRHGETAIVALAGVPGTSKSHVAKIAARAYASKGGLRAIQFSPGYTYEEFIEGPRFVSAGQVQVTPGAFLELNHRAGLNPDKQFVLLIEEFSRADLPKVLGELLTYVEYRAEDDEFTTMYRRTETTRVASNLAILATYNPSDRSAVNLDAAVLRRLRILLFPPSLDLLQEILTDNGLDEAVIAKLAEMFDACRTRATPERFEEVMPFGHGVFSYVTKEADLHELWHEELRHMLLRPRAPQHELYDTVREHYPWHAGSTVTVVGGQSDASGGAGPSSEGSQTGEAAPQSTT